MMIRLLILLLCCGVFARPDERRVLWHDPGPATVEQWKCGPGGCDRAPVAPFQFVREETGGSNPKVAVRDARGRSWSVKFGAEAIPDCFASRFVTAIGYFAEWNYFVDRGRIEGLGKLNRARHVVRPDGSFARARFQMRGQSDLEFLKNGEWSWTDNPFRGSRELAGLKILMMLLSNWDAKDSREGDDSNTGTFRAPGPDGPQLLYMVDDWGATLGRWGGALRRDQSDCAGYALETPRFVTGVHGNVVEFGYTGKHDADIKNGITLDDVRWLLPLLERITPEQLHTGFAAAGASPRQSRCWAFSIEKRIERLQSIAR